MSTLTKPRGSGGRDEGCAGCRAALGQWRTVAGLAGRLTTADVADLDPYVRDRFLATVVAPRRR